MQAMLAGQQGRVALRKQCSRTDTAVVAMQRAGSRHQLQRSVSKPDTLLSGWSRPCQFSHNISRSKLRAASESPIITSEDDVVRVATIGDLVTIHFTCRDSNGEVLQSSRDEEVGPITFELGAGEVMGNKLFQGFDEAMRGLAVGQTTVIEASGGEWQRELLFAVPRDHPEITRLEGRYKNQGGLVKDMLVELANGQLAVIVDITDEAVKIDANNMMAGKKLTFELELLDISKPPVEEETAEDGAQSEPVPVAATGHTEPASPQ